MRIALDATPLLGDQAGIAVFTRGALAGLGRREDITLVAYGLTGRRRLSPVLPSGVSSGRRVPATPALWAWARGWRVPSAEYLAGPVDVVHGTNFVVPPARRAVRVVTVHDLSALRFPELCTRTTLAYLSLVRRAIAEGAWVHTPSEWVAREVCELLDAPPERVRAVYHGAGQWAGELPAGHPAGGLRPSDTGASRVLSAAGGQRYILAIGTVEPRKDFGLLVRAFDQVAGNHPGVALVIAGSPGSASHSLDQAVAQARHRERVVRLGGVSPQEQAALLARAAVLAYPSVYEGFGLPPLEAMHAGVPVVATAAGAVPEVVGDAAIVVPVGDQEGLSKSLGAVLDDSALAMDLVERGKRRVGMFSWDACAAGLVELYRSARQD